MAWMRQKLVLPKLDVWVGNRGLLQKLSVWETLISSISLSASFRELSLSWSKTGDRHAEPTGRKEREGAQNSLALKAMIQGFIPHFWQNPVMRVWHLTGSRTRNVVFSWPTIWMANFYYYWKVRESGHWGAICPLQPQACVLNFLYFFKKIIFY